MTTFRVVMGTRGEFEEWTRLKSYLASQLNRGRIALVLGAGVSVAFNLPDWQGLLDRLYNSKGEPRPTGSDLKRQAEYFRTQYFAGDNQGFIGAVREALYAGISIDFKELRASPMLGAIGSMVMASLRGRASHLITFNWDNLLELYLKYHGFVTQSVIQQRHWSSHTDVTLLHPHGFVPFLGTGEPSDEIVFDQTSYIALIGRDENPWRQQLLSIMRSHTCLFVGLSGTDDNLDSLLYTANQQHATALDNTAFWGVTFTTSTSAISANSWEQRGVFCNVISDYAQLPNLLFEICQEAAHLRIA